MRVTIEQKSGVRDKQRDKSIFNIFSSPEKLRKYEVLVTVQLTDQERSVLATHNLWNTALFKDPFRPPADFLETRDGRAVFDGLHMPDVTIKRFLEDDTFIRWFQTPLEAKDFETQLREDILPKLKVYITASDAAAKPSKDTFDV